MWGYFLYRLNYRKLLDYHYSGWNVAADDVYDTTMYLCLQAITSKVELIVENSDNVEVKFQTKCKGWVFILRIHWFFVERFHILVTHNNMFNHLSQTEYV